MMSVKSMNNCILVTARCRPPCRDRVHLVIQNPCVRPRFDIVDSGLGEVMYWDEAVNQPTSQPTNMVLVYTGFSAKLKIRNYDPTTRYWLTSSRGFYNTSDFFYDDGHFDFTLFPALIDIPVILTMRANHNSCLHRLAVKAYDYDVSIFEYTTQDGVFHRDITRAQLHCRYQNRTDIVSMKIVRLASYRIHLTGTFDGCTNMVTFECDFHVTSNVINMRSSWKGCRSLTSFPLIDTSNVRFISNAWYGCASLTSFPRIDTSRIDTSHFFNNLYRAWYGCASLTSFPRIDTSRITSMSRTWFGCTSLTSFPQIDTGRVVTMNRTWLGCTSLTSFPLINTSRVVGMWSTWLGCTSLTSFPLIDTSRVVGMGWAWTHCRSLTSFPQIDTSRVVHMRRTWDMCISLTSFPRINISSVIEMRNAWHGCNNLPLGHCGSCEYYFNIGAYRKICYYLDNTGGIMPDRRRAMVPC